MAKKRERETHDVDREDQSSVETRRDKRNMEVDHLKHIPRTLSYSCYNVPTLRCTHSWRTADMIEGTYMLVEKEDPDGRRERNPPLKRRRQGATRQANGMLFRNGFSAKSTYFVISNQIVLLVDWWSSPFFNPSAAPVRPLVGLGHEPFSSERFFHKFINQQPEGV